MSAISDLDTLLACMRPSLSDETFAFVFLPEAGYGDGRDSTRWLQCASHKD